MDAAALTIIYLASMGAAIGAGLWLDRHDCRRRRALRRITRRLRTLAGTFGTLAAAAGEAERHVDDFTVALRAGTILHDDGSTIRP